MRQAVLAGVVSGGGLRGTLAIGRARRYVLETGMQAPRQTAVPSKLCAALARGRGDCAWTAFLHSHRLNAAGPSGACSSQRRKGHPHDCSFRKRSSIVDAVRRLRRRCHARISHACGGEHRFAAASTHSGGRGWLPRQGSEPASGARLCSGQDQRQLSAQ